MSRLFWQLPGPAQFLERIGRSMRDGRNVLIVLPRHGPQRMRYVIADLVASNDFHAWLPINAAEDDDPEFTPVELVARQCIAGARIHSAKELSEHEDFRNQIVWVDGIPPSRWRQWRDFIEEYGQHCRARPEHERALFCMLAPADHLREMPREDVVCAIHVWRGIVSRLDMTLFFAHLLAERAMPPMHAKLWNAVGVELAGTDAELAARLANADFPSVLQPKKLLLQFAHERGWMPVGDDAPASWAFGDEDHFDGAALVHSARIVVRKDWRTEIESRIWRGQVGVLFPFIEERRIELLPSLGRFLRVPYDTHFGTIRDVREFELPHLLHQARKGRADKRTVQLLERLTEIRNRLAHLEAVPYEMLTTPELSAYFT